MKYLKLYEDLKDFHHSNIEKYFIISKDDKYVLSAQHSNGVKMVPDQGYTKEELKQWIMAVEITDDLYSTMLDFNGFSVKAELQRRQSKADALSYMNKFLSHGAFNSGAHYDVQQKDLPIYIFDRDEINIPKDYNSAGERMVFEEAVRRSIRMGEKGDIQPSTLTKADFKLVTYSSGYGLKDLNI